MKQANNNLLLLELSRKLKELRKERGLTQEDCYNDTGIHFSRIEQGKRDISFTTLYKICKYFDVTIKEFSDGFFESEENK